MLNTILLQFLSGMFLIAESMFKMRAAGGAKTFPGTVALKRSRHKSKGMACIYSLVFINPKGMARAYTRVVNPPPG